MVASYVFSLLNRISQVELLGISSSCHLDSITQQQLQIPTSGSHSNMLILNFCRQVFVPAHNYFFIFPSADFIPSLRTLLGHPVYLIYLCVTIIQLNSLIGMVTYKPKFIEQHFRQSASKANFLMGVLSSPSILHASHELIVGYIQPGKKGGGGVSAWFALCGRTSSWMWSSLLKLSLYYTEPCLQFQMQFLYINQSTVFFCICWMLHKQMERGYDQRQGGLCSQYLSH